MKKTLIAAASLMLLTPSIALAAWWNPFTWFPPKIVSQISATSSIATTSVKIIATSTPKIIQKKIISVPKISNPPIPQAPVDSQDQINEMTEQYLDWSSEHPVIPQTPPQITPSEENQANQFNNCEAKLNSAEQQIQAQVTAAGGYIDASQLESEAIQQTGNCQ